MMDTNTPLEDKVWSLTYAQIKVLFYVCKGLKNREIADERHVSEGTIKSQLGKIYSSLEIPDELDVDLKRGYLIAKYCEILQKIVADENDLETFEARQTLWKAEKTRQQLKIESAVEGVEKQLEKLKEKQNNGETLIDEPPPAPRISPAFLRIAAGVIVVFIVAMVLFNVFGGDGLGQPNVSISETPEQLSAISTSASLTPEPVITLTSADNADPTKTVLNTPTSLPSDTPIPTSTPPPTPTFTPSYYSAGEPVEISSGVTLDIEDKFGNPNFSLCWAPRPGSNLILNLRNKSNKQFQLIYQLNQFKVVDNTGRIYPVVQVGVERCDDDPTVQTAMINDGVSVRIFISFEGGFDFDTKYLTLTVENISGYGPFVFRKDIN